MTKTSELAQTGIEGLDHVLRGGLPRRRIYLVQGDPGVGKTTLALQYLLEGRARGERVLYITLSETEEEIRAVAHSHGWSLDGVSLFELSALEQTNRLESENTVFDPSEVELQETTQTLLQKIEEVKPARVVFDSLSELRLLAQGALRYRRQILSLKQYFAGRASTVLLLDDRTSQPGDQQLQSLAHGVISMEQLAPEYGEDRRRLRVLKLRGVPFRGGYHDFNIQTGGIVLFPRMVAAEHRTPFQREPLSSGMPGLDTLLGGGLDRGTSSLLIGPAGTGKSTLATRFAIAAAARGERAAIFAFDENVDTLITRSDALGFELSAHVAAGRILVKQIDPAEMGPGEFAHRAQVAVERDNATVVVIDSLNGYLNSMPEEGFLVIQMHELLSYFAQQGVTTLMVMAQSGMIGSMRQPIEVSYLADAVILFRYFEAAGHIRKAISVLKKRSGPHEDTIRELTFGAHGLEVGPPLEQFNGVLTGVPTFLGDHARLHRDG